MTFPVSSCLTNGLAFSWRFRGVFVAFSLPTNKRRAAPLSVCGPDILIPARASRQWAVGHSVAVADPRGPGIIAGGVAPQRSAVPPRPATTAARSAPRRAWHGAPGWAAGEDTTAGGPTGGDPAREGWGSQVPDPRGISAGGAGTHSRTSDARGWNMGYPLAQQRRSE